MNSSSFESGSSPSFSRVDRTGQARGEYRVGVRVQFAADRMMTRNRGGAHEEIDGHSDGSRRVLGGLCLDWRGDGKRKTAVNSDHHSRRPACRPPGVLRIRQEYFAQHRSADGGRFAIRESLDTGTAHRPGDVLDGHRALPAPTRRVAQRAADAGGSELAAEDPRPRTATRRRRLSAPGR